MMAFNRRIDLGLCLQVALEAIRMLERMEMETMAVILIGMLLTPFILGSLWSVGIAVIWQLLTLGFKAGMILFTVCSLYMTLLQCKSRMNWMKKTKEGLLDDEVKPKCTLMDAVLSVFFQTGLRLPAFVWDAGMEMFFGNKSEEKKAVENKNIELIVPKVEPLSPQTSRMMALKNSLMASPLVSPLLNAMLSPMFEEPTLMSTRPSVVDDYHREDFDFEDYLENALAPEDSNEPETRSYAAATPIKAGRARRALKKKTTRTGTRVHHH